MTIYETVILLGTLTPAILFVVKNIENNRYTNRINRFLTESEQASTYHYRSTHAISANTNIPIVDVRALCSTSKNIKRNTLKKETWRLV